MPNTNTKKPTIDKKDIIENEDVRNDVSQREIRLDKKVTVVSFAPWATGFNRILSAGDVLIQGNGVATLPREEIIAQAQSGNKLFTGIDGNGSHACLYIQDEWTRKELNFDTEDHKQIVISKELIKKIFSTETFEEFKAKIEKNIVTRAEKFYLLNSFKSLNIDSYERISYCEQYCGAKAGM